jgi:hypothetical protein
MSSIVTHAKRIDQGLADIVAEYIATKGVTVCRSGAKSNKSQGSKHAGKSTYMKGSRRAA